MELTQQQTEQHDFNDLVALEAQGKAPDGTRDELMKEPERWMAALTQLRGHISAQITQREAGLAEYRIECFRHSDGRQMYAVREAEFLRWKSRVKYMRAAVEARSTEVSALIKTYRNRENLSTNLARLKNTYRDMVSIVEEMLMIDEDEDIPQTTWDRLQQAYDALPEWAHHQQ